MTPPQIPKPKPASPAFIGSMARAGAYNETWGKRCRGCQTGKKDWQDYCKECGSRTFQVPVEIADWTYNVQFRPMPLCLYKDGKPQPIGVLYHPIEFLWQQTERCIMAWIAKEMNKEKDNAGSDRHQGTDRKQLEAPSRHSIII